MAGRTKPGRESTVDATEVARFSALAAEWWDARGKMAVLHRLNPMRLGFIKEAACRHFSRNDKQLDALTGLRLLDIGCGGGILSEPLARLRAEVVGADPSQANIEAAKLHAAEAGVAWAARHRRDWRDLRSLGRPLAALERHGRELYGGRGTRALLERVLAE